MANAHGKDTTVEMDDATPAGGVLRDISAYVDASNFGNAFELADVSAYGDEDRNFIAGLGTHSLQMSGPWDPLLDSYFGSTYYFDTARSVRWRPEGDASPSHTFEAFIEGYTIDGSVSDKVTWSATLRPTDAITRA